MPIVLLRMMLSGGRVHGRETGQQGAHADLKTMCFSSGSSLKYPVGVVLTPLQGGVRTQHAGIWSPDQLAGHGRGEGLNGYQGLGVMPPT